MTSHHAVIDRIEGELAILEIEGRFVDVWVSLLPAGVCEGDAVTVTFERHARELVEAPPPDSDDMDIQL